MKGANRERRLPVVEIGAPQQIAGIAGAAMVGVALEHALQLRLRLWIKPRFPQAIAVKIVILGGIAARRNFDGFHARTARSRAGGRGAG